MKKIAFYGKGGIGKSTTVSNIASSLAKLGFKVLQIGCDPKGDSNISHNEGKKLKTILDYYQEEDEVKLEDVITRSHDGVYMCECGGPRPGQGCAGRGIIAAFNILEEIDAYNKLNIDYVLYDVLGDVVCGGFMLPIKEGYAEDVYIVTSGEMMSLYAASNIAYAIRNFGKNKEKMLKGLIVNKKGIKDEEDIIKRFSEEENIQIKVTFERNPLIQEAEAKKSNIINLYFEDENSQKYFKFAGEL